VIAGDLEAVGKVVHAIAASIELGEQTISSSSQLVVARQSCGRQGNAARLRTTPRGGVCSTERRKHSLAVSVIVRR
jgi:hypothetical protein